MPLKTLSYAELLDKKGNTHKREQAILDEALVRLREAKITLEQWRNLARTKLDKSIAATESLIPASLGHNTPRVRAFFLQKLSEVFIPTIHMPIQYLFLHMNKGFKRQIASQLLADQARAMLEAHKDSDNIDSIIRALGKLVLDYPLVGLPIGTIAGAFLDIPGMADPREISKLKLEINKLLSEQPVFNLFATIVGPGSLRSGDKSVEPPPKRTKLDHEHTVLNH